MGTTFQRLLQRTGDGRRPWHPVVAGVGMLLLFAPAAFAQVCIGSAPSSGQYAIKAFTELVDEGSEVGAGIDLNPTGPVALQGGISSRSAVDGGARPIHYSAGLAFDLARIRIRSASVAFCPAVAITIGRTSWRFDGLKAVHTTVRIPVGIGVGMRVATSAGLDLAPYLSPRLIFRRTADYVELLDTTERSVALGAQGGISLIGSRTFGGISLAIDSRQTAPVIGLQLGVLLP